MIMFRKYNLFLAPARKNISELEWKL